MGQRIGIGYDIHRRVDGRPLVLGGVRFEGEQGLEGHSDADVLVHAIGDALLGAAALGDLGKHFPVGDPRWKDASSLEILKLIRALLEGHGAKVVNVDATVVAESPKLAPVREQMCALIARSLRVGVDQVSVKATTNERVGPLGRSEAIAAWAVALVEIA